tara:strand:- start:1227 stop:7121 length:5895 start_codon:yes stop_codon:yes gene_type:complete
MSFDLFGEATKCDIRVGYISTDRGFVDNIGIHEANQYAKLNPGTQFIFRNREKVDYLNINEVNRLLPEDMLPKSNAGEGGDCKGITGLNPQGDTSVNIDEGLGLTDVVFDTTGQQLIRDTTRAHFYGGGGVGVQGNPVVGVDGSLMSVDVVHPGFGYQYPPLVSIEDDRGVGSGAVAIAILDDRTEGVEELYNREEDYEEYDLDQCIPPLQGVGFGRRYGPNGEDLGDWNPGMYIGTQRDPIAKQIQKYQDLLSNIRQNAYVSDLGSGRRLDSTKTKILEWWTTRDKVPLKVVGPEETTRTKYDVFNWSWGANTGTNPIGEIDNLYIKLLGRRGEPAGLEYWQNLRDSGQSLAQIEEGMKLQPEYKNIILTGNKPVMPDVTYLYGQYWEYDKKSFMNSFAISPVPPSNVKGTDMAGKTYTFEWQEDFPWEGEYTFRVQADNDARLYFDNEPLSKGDVKIGSGGAAGNVISKPLTFKKTITQPGVHKISIDLFNHQTKEIVQKTTNLSEVTQNAESDVVKFKITSSASYANGFQILDLDIDVEKRYKGPQLNETITKTVEYGRPYKVQFRSAGKGSLKSGKLIKFTGLHSANDPIEVTNNNKRLCLKDGDGGDCNASFTIDKGNVRFSDDGKTIEGTGRATFTLSWNDNPRSAGTALGTIEIMDKKWTQSGRSGSKTQTVTISAPNDGGSYESHIKLRNKGEKVIEMEEWTDEDWSDIIASCSSGKFYDINGSTCKFMVPTPPTQIPSTLKDENLDIIFNTVDWMEKANRKLWKINPGAGKDANFLNRFGVLPFDPTEVEKIEKRVTRDVIKQSKASVKFLRGEDGKNYMKVTGTGKAKVFFELNVNDRPGISSLALTEIKIRANDGDVILRRDPNRRFANERASGEFTAGQKYLVKTIGASSGAGSIIGVDKTTIGYDDDITGGYDQNGLLKITAVAPINTTEKITEDVLGYPDHPNASTDDYAGIHDILWNNIKFPNDGNYSIEIMVDDNVVLTFIHPGREDIVIRKDGFKIRGDGSTGTGKSFDVKYFREGTYTLKAELEQLAGKPIAKGNPMALAVQIKTAFIVEDVEVISIKSWNQNPMGVGMVIDAPMPPIPTEIPPVQQGRCPNNPIWTTRTQKGVEENWYPVRVDFWEQFMNRYAISPIPPLGADGSDGAGVSYINNWEVELPHEGFYGLRAAIDKIGKIFIDGNEILGSKTTPKLSLYNNISPNTAKIFLTKGTHQITVQVENDKQYEFNLIDKKIFNTADWASKQNTKITEIIGPKNIDVTFKVSIATMYGAGIKLFVDNTTLFDDNKGYKEPSVSETHTHSIEVGKVYDVEFTSTNQTVVPGSLSPTRKALIIDGEASSAGDRRIRAGGKVYQFDNDGSDWDMNATFRITEGNGRFEESGGTPTIVGTGRQTIELWWNDTGGEEENLAKAIRTIRIGNVAWDATSTYSSNKVNLADRTRTIELGSGTKTGDKTQNINNNSAIQLRTKGKNVVEMEDIPGDFSAGTGGTNNEAFFFKDVVCSATEGEFYDLNGRTCKFRIPSKDRTEIEYGKGLVSGSAKDGVTYTGPSLATYANGELGPFITPTWNTDEEYIRTHNGTTWTMTWSNVDFPEDGTYDIKAEADDELTVKLNGIQICRATVDSRYTTRHDGKELKPIENHSFSAPKGKQTLELTLFNRDFQSPFSSNPAVAAVKITKKTNVAKIDPRTGKAKGKPWTVNPIGVSAILIPPPCPKMITGIGRVDRVEIDDPGNGFTPPVLPSGIESPSYSVGLGLDDIKILDGGINYGPGDVVCVKDNITGEERCFEPEFGPFGEITKVVIIDPPPGEPDIAPPSTGEPIGEGSPFMLTSTPQVRVRSRGKVPTGISFRGVPQYRIIRDPIIIPAPDRLIQVTDLVGLKRTGFYDGRPYYGAVFYKNGIRYAGYYQTTGKLIQIYDTLQESIDARVTTPPSAIQRQGTDINSNNSRLNIPGTPNNLI